MANVPISNLTTTWNNVATTFTGIKLNVTDTASAAGSLLMDLQVGGTSQFRVAKTGEITQANGQFLDGAFIKGGSYTSNNSVYGVRQAAGGVLFCTLGVNGYGLTAGFAYNWFSGNASLSAANYDLSLFRDAAGTLAQRVGVNAQTFRLYNTFTDVSNYERGFMRWNSNILEIGAEAAGTGTQRQLRFPLGTVTASTPLSITQTWNNAAITFTGIQLNVTDTASAIPSLLMDLQLGGVSLFKVDKNSAVTAAGNLTVGSYGIFGAYLLTSQRVIIRSDTGSITFGSADDVVFVRDAANILAQRNGVNAQTFRLYNTYTDGSNYERGFMQWNSNVLLIGTEKAGTGTARALEFQTDGVTRLTIGTTGIVTVAATGNSFVCAGSITGTQGLALGSGSSISSTGANPAQLKFISGTGTHFSFDHNFVTAAGKIAYKDSVITDAGNIEFGTTTGTKIGTATTQKLSFYNSTPVVQPAAVSDATDAASVISQLNTLLARVRTLGLIAT